VAAASLALTDTLTGPSRPSVVARAGRNACLLRVARDGSTDDRDADVVVLLARGAARLPIGVMLPDAALPRLRRLRAGDGVTVGDGAVKFEDLRVAVSRWWDPTIPRLAGLTTLPAELIAASLRHDVVANPSLDDLRPAVRDLSLALCTGAHPGQAAGRLIGLGPGLTPAGDDVLCGVLAAAASKGEDVVRDQVSDAAARCADRTTLLSSALLRAAGCGYVLPELAGLLRALADAEPDRTAQCLDSLGAIGHTSGGAMALGALISLQAWAAGRKVGG
jgi:hypothetical protein